MVKKSSLLSFVSSVSILLKRGTYPLVVILFLAGCGQRVFDEQVPPENTSEEQEKNGSEMEETPVFRDGTWVRKGHMEGAALSIVHSNHEQFVFSIQAYNGANIGEIGGQATVSNDGAEARYIDKEDPSCAVTFIHSEEGIMVEMTEDCQGFAGAGVVLDGLFILDDGIEEFVTLSGLGILSPELDATIQSLLKEDYSLLVERMHTAKYEESNGLKIINGWVRGLANIMETVVIYDDQGHIWIGILVQDEVYYYSNHKDYLKHPPQAMDSWLAKFDGKAIVIR